MSARDYKKLKMDAIDGEVESNGSGCRKTKSKSPPALNESPQSKPDDKAGEDRGRVESKESKQDASLVITRDYNELAHNVGGNHSCIVVVTNRSDNMELRDPVVFAKTGYNRVPPNSRVAPSSSGYCSFRKTSLVLRGTSGVMSYEYDRVGHTSRRFAVMWRIPYRVVNHEENEVAVKWLDVDLEDTIDSHTHTSLTLYREMAGKAEVISKDYTTVRAVAKDGKALRIVNAESGAELEATFRGSCKAVVQVEFHASKTL